MIAVPTNTCLKQTRDGSVGLRTASQPQTSDFRFGIEQIMPKACLDTPLESRPTYILEALDVESEERP